MRVRPRRLGRQLLLLSAAGALSFAAATAPALAHSPTSTAPPRTVVSFTFDDGYRSQLRAADVLSANGLQGTFYINSGAMTFPGYLSRAQLLSMIADGHEIGGQTVNHAHLENLTVAEQRKEICDDRTNLRQLGIPVRDFAYPYGYRNEQLAAVVKSCGYSTARAASGLKDRGSDGSACDCQPALPYEGDRWDIPVKPTIKQGDTVRQLQDWVLQAEKVGGWLPLVFHRICDACAPESMTLADFTRFADWMQNRPSSTSVQTVDSVMNGTPALGAPIRDSLAQTRTTMVGGVQQASSVRREPVKQPGVAFRIDGFGVGQRQVLGGVIGSALILVLSTRVANRGRRHT